MRRVRKTRSVNPVWRCVLLWVFVWTGATFGQDEISEMSAGDLLSTATKKLSTENYGSAVPYMMEYLQRMEGNEDERVLALSQKVRLKLGKILAYMESPLDAAKWLQEYIDHQPRYQPRAAYKLLAVNLYALEEYEGCIAAATNALTRPLPTGAPKRKRAVDPETLSRDERGGFSARQIRRMRKEYAEDDAKLGFSDDLTAEIPDPEPDYTPEELVLLHMTLAEAYSALEQWQASIEHYEFVIENEPQEERKGYAILKLVHSLVALEQFEEARVLVVQLYRTDVRYDVRVNMALMTVAGVLFDAEEYDSALMLYRMVLPRQELVDYQERKMNEIRRATGLPEVKVTLFTNDTGRVETLFGKRYGEMNTTGRKTDAPLQLPPKPPELLKIEEAIGTLVSLPPYENEVLYRIGLLYAASGRPWEAVLALVLMANREPGSEMGLRAFTEALLVLVNPLKEYDRVERLGKAFLATQREGVGPRQVAHALATCYQHQKRWKEIKALLPTIEQFVTSDDPIVIQYECELYFMQAIADLMLMNYEEAKSGFAKVLEEYEGLHQEESATHWHAMCRLFLLDHAGALHELNAYAETWPEGHWIPDAAFHGGVCLFGLQKLEEAQQRFSHVINTFPDAKVYSDACSMRGDLLAAKALLDEAQRDYEEAYATARTVKQGTYPVFQMARMFNLETRHDEILAVVNSYLKRYGDEADVAEATYWIGKTKLAQGLVDEAVAAYRDAIVAYGGDLLQSGVDLMIDELVRIASRRLEDTQRLTLDAELLEAQDKSTNTTLQLRLRVLRAEMAGSTLELGEALIAEIDELSLAPPPVLDVICDASLAKGDYSRSEEILALFKSDYEDSEYLRAALKLRAMGLFHGGRYAQALEICAETQARYGTERDAIWAQILKGRAEAASGAFEAGRKTLQIVLKMREWRGSPYAETAFRLGELEELAGDLRRAFGWYQRTYMMYKGYADGMWAAEAYLASARCLQLLGHENEMNDTYRAMLWDSYVNRLPQADSARDALGAEESREISSLIAQGASTNLVVTLKVEAAE